MRKAKFSSFLPSLISLLLVAGILTVFSACGPKDDGMWMNCHRAQNMVALCGGVAALCFLFASVARSRALTCALYLAALAASALAFLLPGTILPMCMMKTMRCYTVMQPFARIMSAVMAVCAAWGIAAGFRRK